MTELLVCPKCLEASGDSWSQCGKSCPIMGSPHYSYKTYDKYGGIKTMSPAEHDELIRKSANYRDIDVGDDIPY